jgi:hypothetical protein
VNPVLYYYRFPLNISIVGVDDPSSGSQSITEQVCEFKDDIVELLCDKTAALIAGDIESVNEYNINNTSVQKQQ